MNIDPKSETQKPDFEAMAKQYALRLVDEHEGTPQYICYLAGLEDGSHLLQSENQRLTEELESQVRASKFIANELSIVTKINEELVKGLTDAIERMGRARAILTEREGQPDCWQMLNADNLKSILNPLNHEQS